MRVAIVGFPDGTRVSASSISERSADDPERTFGLYLDARWEPTWPADLVDWEDFGLPANPEVAVETADQEAWVRWFADWVEAHPGA